MHTWEFLPGNKALRAEDGNIEVFALPNEGGSLGSLHLASSQRQNPTLPKAEEQARQAAQRKRKDSQRKGTLQTETSTPTKENQVEAQMPALGNLG